MNISGRSELELKALTSQLIRAQEDERKRIARELHDSIGSWLSALKFSLENVDQEIQMGNPVKGLLKQLSEIVGHCIDETRRIITDLRPSLLDDLGIIATIQWFSRWYQACHPHILVENYINVVESDIPEDLKIVIFRILQESMNNAAKYSQATNITLSLHRRGQCLELLVNDDGTGFDVKQALSIREPSQGVGLTSMKERAEISGGTLEITSAQGTGTLIRAFWNQP